MGGRKNNKVVHLTSVHQPLDIRIFHKECRSLAAAGFEVVLVAPAAANMERDGIRIRAVPLPSSRRARMVKTVYQVFQAARDEDGSVYHFHDPELIPVGIALKALGKRVVYDIHENYPKAMYSKDYVPLPLRWTAAGFAWFVEALAAGSADAMVAAEPPIATRFPPAKTCLVQNFPLRAEMEQLFQRPYAGRPNTVAYVGGISRMRGIVEAVAAVGSLPADLPVTLKIAGEFRPPELLDEVSAMPGWARVAYLGWLSRERIVALLAEARVGLVALYPEPNYLDSYPIKMFEYMAAGIPVIASDFPLWRQIVTSCGCGLLVDPLDHGAVAEAIRYLLTHPDEAAEMGRRGQEAVWSTYTWDAEADRLVGLYRSLTA